jgi:hypothetical protein
VVGFLAAAFLTGAFFAGVFFVTALFVAFFLVAADVARRAGRVDVPRDRVVPPPDFRCAMRPSRPAVAWSGRG